MNDGHIEEWEILFKESCTTHPHLSIIPLHAHIAVIKRLLRGETYHSAMLAERIKFSEELKKQSIKEPKRSHWKDLLKI